MYKCVVDEKRFSDYNGTRDRSITQQIDNEICKIPTLITFRNNNEHTSELTRNEAQLIL